MRVSQAFRPLFAVAVIAASSMAFAHPKLVSSTPSDKAEVTAPAKIELNFSERLLPEFCAANLLMTAMPGSQSHEPMKMAFKVTGGADEKTMVITPTQPLPAGSYRVDWQAVSADTHRMTGSVTFQVR